MGSFHIKNRWVSCTKTLRDRFSGLYGKKNFLCIDEKALALEQSFKATTKFRRELLTGIEIECIPLTKHSALVEDIHVHVKTWEASKIFDLALQIIQD